MVEGANKFLEVSFMSLIPFMRPYPHDLIGLMAQPLNIIALKIRSFKMNFGELGELGNERLLPMGVKTEK